VLLVAEPRRVVAAVFAGDRRVWRWAGIAGAVAVIGLLAFLLIPRDYYTGTNSVSTRSVVAELKAGQTLCIPGQTIPEGTGAVRLEGGARPPASVALDLEARTPRGVLRGSVPGLRLNARAGIDVPVRTVGRDLPAQICVTPRGGGAWLGGMIGQQGNDRPLTLDGRRVENRVALWYLPPGGGKRGLLAQFPEMARRAALFRPGFVGPWTYWLLFGLVLPGLAIASVALLARAVADVRARVPRPLAIWAIAFGLAASFALITPVFQTPDESEHFAAVEHIAETGKAVDRQAGDRYPYSQSEIYALEALRHFSSIESPVGRPPWRPQAEAAWLARVAAVPGGARQDDGGGFSIATSAHSPLYYALLAPGYLIASGSSLPSQVFAARLISCALGALAALFAFLTVRELLPRQRWAAPAAGLLVALHPMFGFISGAINNDVGVNAAAAALTYLLIRGLRRGLTLRLGLVIGAVLAVAPLLKGTGYFLYPVAALALLGMLMRGRDRRTLLAVGGVVAAGLACTLAWGAIAPLFGRSLVTAPNGEDPTQGILAFSDPIAYLDYVWQLFLPPLPGSENLYAQRVPAFSIYIVRGWGAFGWYAILFPSWLFVLIGAALLAAGAMAVATLWRERWAARRLGWEILVLAAIPVCVFLGVEAVYATDSPRRVGPVAEQGRYIFPAAVALACWGAAACLGLGRRLAVPLAAVAVTLLAGLTLYSRLLELAGFYS
jgi:Predicted membrane protein (DUF2142)